MRIMLGVHQFLPDFYAGTENLTFNTARELCKRGHEVRVFTGYVETEKTPGTQYFDHYEFEGIPVDRYHYSRTDPIVSRNVIEAAYNNPRSAEGFERIAKSFSPDIVHFYHLQWLSGSTIDVCRCNRIPVVFTATDYWVVCPLHQLYLPDGSHCLGPDDPPANCLKHLCQVSSSWILRRAALIVPRVLLKMVMQVLHGTNLPFGKPVDALRALTNRKAFLLRRLEYVDRVMVATQFMGEMLAKWGLEPSKIDCLPFAVVGTDREPVPKQINLHSKDLQIGYIGTLCNYKGAHVLLGAIQRIPKEMPVVFKLYGDENQYPDYVEKLRVIAGADNRIQFCGTFPPDGIGEVLRTLDVLVVPSLWHENTPLVIHEALGAGLPVVGSDVSGVNQLVRHGNNGLLFERGDEPALAKIFQQLHKDRKLLETLSGNCMPVISMETYVDRLEQVYTNVV